MDVLKKLQNTTLSNFEKKIDIVYTLQFYKNITSLVDQLLNIYNTNKHYNFRVVIIINKNCKNPVSKKQLEDLKLPNYVIIGRRTFIHGWGSDLLCTSFSKNYYQYVQKLDFKYIIPLAQGTYFVKKMDLSVVKEVDKDSFKLYKYETSYHNKFLSKSSNLKKFCEKNNFKIIYRPFWGSVYTKDNIEKILNFLNNSEITNNLKIKNELNKICVWPQYLLKSIENYCCEKTININITKKYFNYKIGVGTYPSLNECKKDLKTDYEEETIYKGKVIAVRSYIFSIHRIKMSINDPVKKYIRDNLNKD